MHNHDVWVGGISFIVGMLTGGVIMLKSLTNAINKVNPFK